MDLFGGMISFVVTEEIDLMKIANHLDLFKLAVSFGGVESLLEIPAFMTHERADGTDAAVENNLVRLSAGLEDAEDLIEELSEAINGCLK